MRREIKVCGMAYPDNIHDVAALHPDYIGLIFHTSSPRNAYLLLPTDLPAGIRRVGVFVNRPASDILAIAAYYDLSAVQLHGDETPEFCQSLKGHGFEVWKAVGIETAEDFKAIERYDVDRIVLDKKSPSRGGTGRKFDWTLLEHYTAPTPFMLAGGIGPEDAQAVAIMDHPRLVGFDLNSRFESEPGVKDITLLKSFL